MTRKITSLLLVLAMVLGLCSSAWAAGAVSDYPANYYCYSDTTGKLEPQSFTYTNSNIVSASSSGDVEWNNGIYVVSSSTTINGNVKISGDVKLILCSSRPSGTSGSETGTPELTINGGIYNVTNDASLTIYACAQDGVTGAGKLTVNGYTDGHDGVGHGINLGDNGSLTVHGGIITVNGKNATGDGNTSCGIEAHELTVHGGKLEVYAGKPTSGENTGYSMAIELLSSTISSGEEGEEGEEGHETIIPAQLTVTGGEVYAVGADVTAPSDDATSYGIYMTDGNMTVSGGKVTGKGGNVGLSAASSVEGEYYSTGILVWKGSDESTGKVEIRGGNVYAIGQDTAALNGCNSRGLDAGNGLTVTSGTLTANGGKSYDSYGILVGQSANGSATFTVSGGTVTATGGEAKSSSLGINANILKIGNGTVNATGGTVTAASHGADSFGVSAGTVTVKGGTLNAKGGDVTAKGYSTWYNEDTKTDENSALDANSYGIYANPDSGVDTAGMINISGGTVNATGGTATVGDSKDSDTANGANSRGIDANIRITIDGGTVNAKGSTATSDMGTAQSLGVVSPNVDATGGTLNATGDNVTTGDGGSAESYGIYAWSTVAEGTGVITVSGNAKVTAESGEATGVEFVRSVGIYVSHNLKVSGGTVTTSGKSYDIRVDGGAMTVTDGEIKSNRESDKYAIMLEMYGELTVSGGKLKLMTSDIKSNSSESVKTSNGITLSDLLADKYGYYRKNPVTGAQTRISIDADQTTLDGNVSVRLVKHFRYHPDTVDKSQSATTGDPGIALYGVMTLLSYTGSALVIRGRKKF